MPRPDPYKNVMFRKIELDSFIKKLVEVYNSGADYIDLVANNKNDKDLINIIVRDEYLSEEKEYDGGEDDDEIVKDDDVIDPKTSFSGILSDEDINRLL